MRAFDRKNRDPGQVRDLQPAYNARRAELDAAGLYPYNDSFKGHLGTEFATDRDEDFAIYALQNLHDLDDLAAKVAAFKAEGAEPVEHLEGVKRYSRVARFGWYMGGTGWAEFSDVRLSPYDGKSGRPWVAIPKGKRTHGFDVSTGTVLGIPA